MKAMSELRQVRKFRDFLEQFAEEMKKQNSLPDPESLMIMPVQRVPRYVLLLKELKRNTHPNDPVYARIKSALKQMEAIGLHINNMKRDVENMEKLLSIQKRIMGDFGEPLVAAHRRLLVERNVHAIVKTGLLESTDMKECCFFLFSDVMIWCDPKLNFIGKMFLYGAVIKDYKFPGARANTPGLEIVNGKDNLIMEMKDKKDQETWKSHIIEAIEEERSKKG